MARRTTLASFFLCALAFAAGGCTTTPQPGESVDRIAEDYTKLSLAIGRHDDNYVDAYYGPAAWKADADRDPPAPVARLLEQSRDLLRRLQAAPQSDRVEYLEKQTIAAEAFLRLSAGEKMPLAEEARLFYDIEPTRIDHAKFEQAIKDLDALYPGQGELTARADAFSAQFNIPPDRLQAVVDESVRFVRERSRKVIKLPRGENFRVAFVKHKPWGAYNWYHGNFKSLIAVNTDLPMSVTRIVGLMAHEGYPGHHTSSSIIDQKLVRERGWVEHSVQPLYSPSGVLAEGLANAGVDIVTTEDERQQFLKDTLAPLAGLSGLDFDLARKIADAREGLAGVRGEAAFMLLEDGRPESEVVDFLVHYGLMEEGRARKAIEFFRVYRAYEFTYEYGDELVKEYIGLGPDRTPRFVDLLQRPATPSFLRREIAKRTP